MRARAVLSTLVLLVAGGIVPVAALAQSRGTINGTVRDSAGTIAFAEVSIVGTDAAVVTDEFGRFRFTSVPFGSVELKVRRLGYTPTTQIIQFSKGTEPVVEILMSAAPGYLPSVEVHEPRQVYDSRLQGFKDRSTKGIGYFITRERLEKLASYRFSDVIREVPGARLRTLRGGGTTINLRGANCAPLVFVDGNPAGAGVVDLDMFDLGMVEGIEVYSGLASVPPEFVTARGLDRCGVVAIWSRPFRPKAKRPPPTQAVKSPALDSLVSEMSIFTVDQVDTPAGLIAGTAVPEYPDSLRRLGVDGKVIVELVVNVDGNLDPASLNLVSSTHQLFTDAVQQSLASAKFRVATLRSRPVRQVLQVPFVFKTEKVSQNH
jgi:TonB family protein